MKSVNRAGVQQYSSPRSNMGVNRTKQCSYDTQCPIGFKCSGGNCINN